VLLGVPLGVASKCAFRRGLGVPRWCGFDCGFCRDLASSRESKKPGCPCVTLNHGDSLLSRGRGGGGRGKVRDKGEERTARMKNGNRISSFGQELLSTNSSAVITNTPSSICSHIHLVTYSSTYFSQARDLRVACPETDRLQIEKLVFVFPKWELI